MRNCSEIEPLIIHDRCCVGWLIDQRASEDLKRIIHLEGYYICPARDCENAIVNLDGGAEKRVAKISFPDLISGGGIDTGGYATVAD